MADLEQPIIETPQPTVDPAEGESTLGEYRQEREAAEAEPQGGTEKDERPKSKGGGFQRRIDQLTREKAELARQLYESRQGKPSPEPGQFESMEEFSARVIREAAERERQKPAPSTEQQDQQRQQEEFERAHAVKRQAFDSRVAESAKRDVHLAELLKGASKMEVPHIALPAIVDQSNGHDVFIYLVRNPEARQQLVTLWQTSRVAAYQATGDPIRAEQAGNGAVIEHIRRISAALEFGTIAPRAQVVRPQTTAPTPINPVGGAGGPTVEKDTDEMSLKEYRKYREKGGR